jgi:N-acetylmuramoyl-L-alanine amidase
MSKITKIVVLLMIVVGFGFLGNEEALASGGFTDVSSSHWAKAEIDFLSSRGIIDGYSSSNSTSFKPENQVTRAQAAKMLVLAKGKKEIVPTNTRFNDVPLDHWAVGWIEQAVQSGYFDGHKDGSFDPQGLLTRAQMSKVVANAFGLNIAASSDKPIVFSDINADFWAASYVNALYYEGVADGSQAKFRPNNDITRAQFSAFISRALSDEFKLSLTDNIIAKGKVTASSLNVRSAPTTGASVLGRLAKNDVVNVYSINGYWTKIGYNGKTAYVHKTYLKLVNVGSNPLKNRIIVVDPGHGGRDPGTVNGSVYEKNIVMDVSSLVAKKLQSSGARVILTRYNNDQFPSLEDRVDISENKYAELFVSVHVNAAVAEANGTETYYNSTHNDNATESYYLAKAIQDRIVSMVNMNNRGVKDAPFFVIKNQEIPSVLVELGFITNDGDLSKLTSSYYKELYAEAIYQGIRDYYTKY